MNPKSTPLSLREADYASLSSRERKTLATFLLQMPERDESRGARITQLREDRGLSQPQVIRGLEEQEGAHVISLRGYQLWEAGHGIQRDNLDALARFHGVDRRWIERGETPDLIEMSNGRPATIDHAMGEQLDRIERKLDEVLERLREDDEGEGGLPAEPPIPPAPEPTAPAEDEPQNGEADQRRPAG